MKLPTIAERTLLTQAPQSSITTAEIVAPYQQLGRTLGNAADTLEAIAEEAATTAGQNAVYRDGNGALTFDRQLGWMRSGRAYNRAAEAGYAARIANEIDASAAKLSLDADGNAEKFENSWKGFSDGLLAKAPEALRGRIATSLEQTGTQQRIGVMALRQRRDLAVAEGDMKARLATLNDQATILAAQGGVNTDAYRRIQDERRDLYRERVGNPAFGYGQREADLDLQRTESSDFGTALVGDANRALEAGGVAAARDIARRIQSDEKLLMSSTDRQQMAGLIEERIRGWQAEKRANLEPLRDAATTARARLDQRIEIDDPAIDDTIVGLARNGDIAGAVQLRDARERARVLSSISLEDSRSALGRFETYKAGQGGTFPLPNDPNLPAGMRNNNPGNIKFVGQGRDRGVIGPSKNTDQGDPQAVFETPEAGMREMYGLIMRKYGAGKVTANQMIAGQGGWTPGNTEAAANVARSMGIGPDEPLNLQDPKRAQAFMRGLLRQEHGKASDAYGDDMLQAAITGAKFVAGGSPALRSNLEVARALVGMTEAGNADTISAFIKKTTGVAIDPRQTAWCAGFVNGVLGANGVTGTGSLSARSFMQFGTATDKPELGDIVVLSRGPDQTKGHVGFFAGYDERGNVKVLGGNQGGGVNVSSFDGRTVAGFRRPPTVADGTEVDLGRLLAGSSSYQPYNDPKVIDALRTRLTTSTKDLVADIRTGLNVGRKPSLEDLQTLGRSLAVIDDADLRQQVVTMFDASEGADAIMAMPPEEREPYLAALESSGAINGFSEMQRQMLADVDRQQAAQAAALKGDPLGWGMDTGKVPVGSPVLPGGDPNELGNALAERQSAVTLLQSRTPQVGTISALRPAELDSVSRFWGQATPEQQLDLIGKMASNLSPDTYRATMTAIVGKDAVQGAGTAGALYKDAPDIALGILRGQAIMKVNPELAPKRQNDDFKTAVDTALPMQAFGPMMEGKRQSVLDGAIARYVDLTAQAGGGSDFDGDRMEKAISDVAGGLLEWNGRTVYAPRYGMSQDDFDDAMAKLTPQQVSGAVTAGGKTITADDIRDNGYLRVIAPGRYLVQFGEDDAPTFAMAQNGRPFVLMLGAGQ